jgi:putative spermidine/putrescine transport system permease protein
MSLRWPHRTPLLLCVPLLAFLGFFFLLPVAQMVVMALTSDAGGFPSLVRFSKFLTDPYYQTLIFRTFRISVFTTLLSLVLAYPVAMLMRGVTSRWQTVLVLIMVSPLLTSVVVRTLAWVILLARQGLFNQTLEAFGIPPFRFLYNEGAVVIALTHVFFGYMVISLLTSLRRIDDTLYAAAANLGASQWKMFTQFTLPLSLPGILAGSLLVFTLSAGSYATPSLVGGSRHSMMGVEVYNLAIQSLAWGDAAVVATILFVMIAGAGWIVTAVGEGGRRKVIFQ